MAFPSSESRGLQIVSSEGELRQLHHWTDDFKASRIDYRRLAVEATLVRAFYEDKLRAQLKPNDSDLCQMLLDQAVQIKEHHSWKNRRLANNNFLLGLDHIKEPSRNKWSSEKYTEFLWFIAQDVDPEHALLMKCTFSTRESKGITLCQKAKLIKYMRENKAALSCSDLQSMAKRVFESANMAFPSSNSCGLQIVSLEGELCHWADDFKASRIDYRRDYRRLAVEATLVRAFYEDKLRAQQKPNDSDLCQMLLDQAAKMNKKDRDEGRLANNDFIDHVDEPSRNNWSSEKYTEFLWFIAQDVGPEHALLMKCTFSTNITRCQKANLIQYMRKNKAALSCIDLQEDEAPQPRSCSAKIPPQMPGQTPELDKDGLVKFSGSEGRPNWMSFCECRGALYLERW
jgi:hypothetical protein